MTDLERAVVAGASLVAMAVIALVLWIELKDAKFPSLPEPPVIQQP